MHREVKKSADIGNIKDLKYIFVDSLDVDPTFEEYLDDYNYCAEKNLFERHKDLTPFTDRKADWNDNYWEKIKRDLLKNFSRERLDHMRRVAPVVNAEKVARLQKERQAAARTAAPKISPPPVNQSTPIRTQPAGKSKAQQQQEEIEAAKLKLAQENAQVEQQQRKAEQQREQVNEQTEDEPPKKSSGIAPWIIVAAGAALIAIAYNLLK